MGIFKRKRKEKKVDQLSKPPSNEIGIFDTYRNNYSLHKIRDNPDKIYDVIEYMLNNAIPRSRGDFYLKMHSLLETEPNPNNKIITN